MKKEFAMSLSQSYRQDLLNATQLAEQGMLSPSQQAFSSVGKHMRMRSLRTRSSRSFPRDSCFPFPPAR